MLGDYPDDDPAHPLEHFQAPNVLDELAPVCPVLVAVVFDNHVMHIPEHQVLLASVEARRNPQLIQAVLKHIQSHLGFLAGNAQHGPMNPILASIGNQPTLPPGTPDQVVLPHLPSPAAAGPALPPPGARPAPPPNAIPTPNAAPGMPPQVNLPKPPKGAPPIPVQ